MGRNEYDLEKVKKIIRVLLRNPDGIWLRKLSRDSKLPLSTVHYYVENVLKNIVENIGARDEEGRFFGVRIIKLKTGVFNRLSESKMSESALRKLLKATEILSNSG